MSGPHVRGPENFLERLRVIFLPVLPADSVQPGGPPAQQVGVELALAGDTHRAVGGRNLLTCTPHSYLRQVSCLTCHYRDGGALAGHWAHWIDQVEKDESVHMI